MCLCAVKLHTLHPTLHPPPPQNYNPSESYQNHLCFQILQNLVVQNNNLKELAKIMKYIGEREILKCIRLLLIA